MDGYMSLLGIVKLPKYWLGKLPQTQLGPGRPLDMWASSQRLASCREPEEAETYTLYVWVGYGYGTCSSVCVAENDTATRRST